MASTPLIQPLRVSGGTLFSLSSASADLTRSLQSDTKKFRFSHYALLELPNIDTPLHGENDFQFNTIEGAWYEQTSSAELNLVQSFQNYVLNFETMLTNRLEYDPTIDTTVAERVFWKWLKELGVMRWDNASNTQVAPTVTDSRYVEKPTDTVSSSERYNQVVKYISTIDMKNALRSSANTYEEVFILVPTEHGSTPTVLFKTIDDTNYPSATSVVNNPTDPTQLNYIVGRGPNDIQPAGLDMHAYFDDAGTNIPTTINGVSGKLFGYSQPNSYDTEATFDNTELDLVVKHTSSPNETVTYLRSRLDGVTLDFDQTSLYDFTTHPEFLSLSDYNASSQATDFKFNCVLLYYEMFDPANPEISVTNLYGILFINPVALVNGGSSQIESLVKLKPNKITQSGGTSYGFRFNFKVSTSLDQVSTEVTVNEFSNFSMQMFTQTMSNMLVAADNLEIAVNQVTVLQQQVLALQDLITNGTTLNNLQIQVNALEKTILANQALFTNSASIIQMITNLSNDVNMLLQGQTPIQLALNLSQLQAGYGIIFDKSVPNQLTISSSTGSYSVVNSVQQWPSSGPLTYSLTRGNNLIVLRSLTPSLELSDRYIQLDDSVIPWVAGQSIRLSINFDLDMHGFVLYLVTDKLGITNPQSTPYLNQVAQFSEQQMRTFSYDNSIQHNALFDIICLTPPTTLTPGTFQVDKLR